MRREPITSDGVLLKVGDRVYTRPASEERQEVVYVGGSMIVVLDEYGEPRAEHASLCHMHEVTVHIAERERLQAWINDVRQKIPEKERRVAELTTLIEQLERPTDA